MAHALQLPPYRGLVGAFGCLADATEPEGAQGLALLAARPVGGADLPDAKCLGHQAGASACGVSSSSGAILSRPSTSRTVRPRSSATSSGLLSDWSATTVAFTRLI